MKRLALACAAGAGLLGGCASHGAAASKPGETVAIAMTPAGCTPRALRLTAGAHEFRVVNDGAAALSEAELVAGDRIVGEAENVTPGLTGSFTLDVAPGTYALRCPGGSGGDAVVTVVASGGATAAPDARSAAASAAAVARYREYLVAQTSRLSSLTNRFATAVEAGDRTEAERLYPTARVSYERIEPVAEQFKDLDASLDARANDVPAARWTGFHHIEKVLWRGEPMAEAKPYAAKLERDCADLRAKVRTIALQPAMIANGAVDLLDEVVKTKVTGEEDRYSHTDLSDFQANVDGAHAAYDALAPLLRTSDPGLAAKLQARFGDVDRRLARYADGAGFVPYGTLSPGDVRQLAGSVDALAEPLSKVARRVVQVG